MMVVCNYLRLRSFFIRHICWCVYEHACFLDLPVEILLFLLGLGIESAVTSRHESFDGDCWRRWWRRCRIYVVVLLLLFAVDLEEFVDEFFGVFSRHYLIWLLF